MMKCGLFPLALCLGLAGFAQAREAKLVRSPSYHDGKVAFSYLGDIWVAKEDGTGIVHWLGRQQGSRPDPPVFLARRQDHRVFQRPRRGARRLFDPQHRG